MFVGFHAKIHAVEMTQLVALVTFLSLTSAFPQLDPIAIIRQEIDVGFDGTYRHSYETANGISVEESGFVKNGGDPQLEALVAKGSFSYTAPDGTPITVEYTADENGFQPKGDHLPQVPEAIQRAFDHFAKNPPKE